MENVINTTPDVELTSEVEVTPEVKQIPVVEIQFRPGQKVYYFDPGALELKEGDHVIMDTARGPEYGICASGIHPVAETDVVAPLRSVIRLATEADERTVVENRSKEKKAFEVCHKKIDEMGLDMQLVSVECAFDGSKLLFFFTAEERVDFRELVKNLAFAFHTRIELRQIGVRDKAKMVGGLGICGRPFCCTSFLDDFQPVSIKMAKTQNLSLNPAKISGTCGRLMCCLKYEQAAYEYLLKTCPKEESFVDTPEGRGTVVEVALLKQTVKVRMEEDPETVSSFRVEEIAVLRNGKAKKTDAPIPADLAPISGGGKRARKEKKPEEGFLDPIKFRYRQEAVVEETKKPAEPEKEPKPARSRSKGPRPENRRPQEAPKPKQNQEKPKQTQEKPRQTEDQPKGEKPANKPGKPNGRRPNYHHRRKPKPEGGNQNQ